jgi:RNA polymerase primary sigma factor
MTELLRTAARRPLLTADEEIRLARRIERGDNAAKDEMIERNLRLVIALARHYQNAGVPLEDLVQEGVLGLIRAVEKFDHRRELRFSTYAVWWIRRALLDAVDAGHAIRVPGSARRRMAAGALADVPRVTASLDEPVGDGATPLGELIADPRGEDPWARISERDRSSVLLERVRLLPRRQREVLLRRYGLDGEPPQSHEEIGAWLGVGYERSRQLELQALHWLRELGGGAQLAA